MRGVRSLLAALAVMPAAAQDARTQEAARLTCSSDLGRSDVTLFGNGTVRSRRWDAQGELTMMLAELSPEDLAGFLARLAAEDLSEVATQRGGTAGEWLETCALDLALPGDSERHVEFGGLDTLPLTLARAVGIVRELQVVADQRRPVETLPPDYTPTRGDVLLRQDGGRYQVEGLTSDGRAVELLGLDQPLTLYVALESLRGEFRRVVARP